MDVVINMKRGSEIYLAHVSQLSSHPDTIDAENAVVCDKRADADPLPHSSRLIRLATDHSAIVEVVSRSERAIEQAHTGKDGASTRRRIDFTGAMLSAPMDDDASLQIVMMK